MWIFVQYLLISSQRCLEQLEMDPVFNPLYLGSNLYPYLRMRGLLSRSYGPRSQSQARSQRREPNRPAEGSTPRQVRTTTKQGLKCSQKFNLIKDQHHSILTRFICTVCHILHFHYVVIWKYFTRLATHYLGISQTKGIHVVGREKSSKNSYKNNLT